MFAYKKARAEVVGKLKRILVFSTGNGSPPGIEGNLSAYIANLKLCRATIGRISSGLVSPAALFK